MKTQARILYTNTWRDCDIIRRTPKTHNYPDGGAYIQWNPLPVNSWESSGGWVSGRDLRETASVGEVDANESFFGS